MPGTINHVSAPQGQIVETRPSYYWNGDVDVIRVIEAYEINFHVGNALKYVVRAGKKGSAASDLAKALEYLRRWQCWAGTFRPRMHGAFGPDFMEPAAVADHFGLSDARKYIVTHLLQAAVEFDEDHHVRCALEAIEAELARLRVA